MFRQETYGEQIESQIQEKIDDKVGVFKERVEMCLHIRNKNIENGVTKNGRQLNTLITLVTMLEGQLREVTCEFLLTNGRVILTLYG